MISTKSLLYGLDVRLNKVDTLSHQAIPDEDKLLVLNRCQNELIKKKVSGNNIYKLGLDSFKKRYEDLQTLIIPEEKVQVIKEGGVYDSYSIDLSGLSNKYMFLIGVEASCSKGNCSGRIVRATRIAKHADLPVLMENSNYRPSFEYQETLAQISSDKIYLYTDGSFTIDHAYITYLKYPQKMGISGFIDLDGNPSVDSDCELNEYLEDELLDLATLEFAMNTENQSSIQNSLTRLQNNE